MIRGRFRSSMELSSRITPRCVKFTLYSFILLMALSLISVVSNVGPLLYTKSSICRYWREQNQAEYSLSDLTWWQRACSMESDWETMDMICTDTRLMGNWPICFDEPYTPVRKDKDCIVYSFGIANDFRFDDALARMNCTVFSFDPSMGVGDHLRGERVHFKNMGLGAEDNHDFVPRVDGYADSSSRWNILKLSSIMKLLGHSRDSLTVLKMDIENNEWAVLDNLLSEGLLQDIPQVLVEWHIFNDSPDKNRFPKMHSDYLNFKRLGFKKFWMRNEGRNHWLPQFSTQAETAYVNGNYKKRRHV